MVLVNPHSFFGFMEAPKNLQISVGDYSQSINQDFGLTHSSELRILFAWDGCCICRQTQ